MARNPDPRKPSGRTFERKALLAAIVILALVTISYFLLRGIDMETASDRPHGGPDPDYGVEQTVPPADPSPDGG